MTGKAEEIITEDCGGNRRYNFRQLSGDKTIRFSVKAANDVSICLTNGMGETPFDMFEVFIGGWGGHTSAIRRNKRDDIVKISTPNILHPQSHQRFWIRVTDTSVNVGRDGESEPFMKYTDAISPPRATYFGFCTAWGSTGEWIFENKEPWGDFESSRKDKGEMDVYHTSDCGVHRRYSFHRMNGRKTVRFSVKTPHDASICLTNAMGETPMDMFEVFIGGWGGHTSAIRRNKRDDVVKIPTPNILHPQLHRGFWIIVTETSIKVGRENDCKPFMVYEDEISPPRISCYGICTAWGATGEWLFYDDQPTLDIIPYHVEKGEDPLTSPIRKFRKECLEISWCEPEPEEMFDMEQIAQLFAPRKFMNRLPNFCVPAYPSSRDENANLEWIRCGEGIKNEYLPVTIPDSKDSPLVAAAFHRGGFILGMLQPKTSNLCQIPWDMKTFYKSDFYLLSNCKEAKLTWIKAKNGDIPVGALEAGYAETGEPLYVGYFKIKGTLVIGKVHRSHKVCYAPYGGLEHNSKSYRVLCHMDCSCQHVCLPRNDQDL